MSDPNQTISAGIDRVAEVLTERARVLHDFAQAIREDESLADRLGQPHAGAANLNQILGEVEAQTKSVDLYHLRHTAVTEFGHAQRG